MKWENITSAQFEEAVATCQGVGLIPIGVLESHASHLPLGTDLFTAYFVANKAAEVEPVIVFPQYPFSINHETAHLPGGMVINRELAFALLENVCDEMHRNGIMKIILLSGHSGNRHFLPLFVQTLPEKRKPYVVYWADLPVVPDMEEILDHQEYGHACEAETSMIRHIEDDLVKMDEVPPKPFANRQGLTAVREAGGYTQVDWYAQYPHMYVGDAHGATAEKGQKLLNCRIEMLVDLIGAIKADDLSPALVAEFNRRQAEPSASPFWKEK